MDWQLKGKTMMSSEQLQGVLRTVLAMASGYIVGQGWADANTVATVGGGIITIAVAFWSVKSKPRA